MYVYMYTYIDSSTLCCYAQTLIIIIVAMEMDKRLMPVCKHQQQLQTEQIMWCRLSHFNVIPFNIEKNIQHMMVVVYNLSI